MLKRLSRELGVRRVTGDFEAFAATRDLYIETCFDLTQVFIKRTAQVGETLITDRSK